MMKSQETFPVTAGDLNIFHARVIADQQITFVLDFSKSLDVDKLTVALAALHEMLPILSSTIHKQGSHFQRIRVSRHQTIISIVSEPAHPREEIVRFIGSPCNPEREPPVKLLLLRDHGEDTLCFKIDHTISDAAGLRTLLFLFAEAYTTARITQPVNYNRGFGQVFRRFSPVSLLKAVWRANLPIPGRALWHGPLEGDETFVEHVLLEPGRFERIREGAKRSNATINDVLLAGLYRAVFTYLPPEDTTAYPVMVPVDMRRYLPGEQRGVIANLSSAIYPRLVKIPNEARGDTLRRIKGCMDKFKKDQPGLGAMFLMTVGALRGGKMLRKRYRQAATRGSRFINYTNFGVLDETRLIFGQVPIKQAYGVGPIQYAPGVLIALSTFRDTLHLVVQGKGNEQFRGFVREFLGAILQNLE
ncbi:MAG TPA: condensation domain-containing protein [Thermodesulfobacteriota bacterium]|nr:condensation domain-containing protein [Thermodesulfobacteriota bacterium]